MRDKDFMSGSFLLIFSVIGFIYAQEIPNIESSQLSAAFYPKLLFILLGLCGIALSWQGWRRQEKIKPPNIAWKSLVPILVIFTLYACLLEIFGFVIPTAVFVFTTMFLLGIRKISYLLSIPLFSTLIIYYVFVKIFMINLP